MGSYITSKISAEIKANKIFSILAGETADIFNKENLSLVVRFVNLSKNIREEFIGLCLCEYGTSGEAVKQMILKAVQDLGLTMDD